VRENACFLNFFDVVDHSQINPFLKL